MASLSNLPAPAKLNLFLHVIGQRTDGYHLLQSVFALIDWADQLHIETRADGQLFRHDIGPALPADDLCLRAARLLQQESGTGMGADISIDKQVPWGAGMGGGSSDAATVLLALNQLWQLHWPTDRLASLALRLGADVPFFIRGHNAWVEGIGEQITPITLPPQVLSTPIAVLKPPITIPTQAIFSSPALSKATEPVIVSLFLAEPKCFGRNDLQAPAELYSSQISQALEIMQGHFGNSRMTGSGSAVFSWVDAHMEADVEADATNIADAKRGKNSLPTLSFAPTDLGLSDPVWAGRLCRLLARHPLFDALG